MRALSVMLALFALFALATAAAGCRRGNQCLPMCELRAKELGCGRPYKCKEECDDLHSRTVCRAELDKFEACFLKEPTKNWFCDEEAKPAPSLNVCTAERTAVGTCLEKASSQPAPGQKL